MPARARRYVTSPTVSPLPYGLWSVVQETDDPDPHWRGGVEYQPDLCLEAQSTVGTCPEIADATADDFAKAPTGRVGTVGADPFTIHTSVDCGPVGGMWEEAATRAMAAFTAGEARAAERAFWTGQVTAPTQATVYPHLAADAEVTDPGAADPGAYQTVIQPAAEIPEAGPLDLVDAVGVLEGAMAGCYPGVPVLHVPRGALAELSARDLVVRQGPQLKTLSGSLVAAGAGYPGTGPDGTLPDWPQMWIYATGAVQGRRSQVSMPSREASLDRGRNHLVLIPERTYVIGWDCCLFAALVQLGGTFTS